MSLVFEELINSYLDNEYGHRLEFLNKELTKDLKSELIRLIAEDKLVQAGIGQKTGFKLDTTYRKDKIHWLEKSSQLKAELLFFQIINSFVLYLNQTCFAGITNFEFHYAVYEPGSFYRKHIDQFSKNDSRVFSVIIYLNEDWQKDDGGELQLYLGEEKVKISPQNGSIVFFDSAKIPHEVLETNVPRYSITGWLRRD